MAGGLSTGVPIIPDDANSLDPPYPDPLPQALILTAIVIGLGVSAYLLSLIRRAAVLFGGDDIDRLREEVDIE